MSKLMLSEHNIGRARLGNRWAVFAYGTLKHGDRHAVRGNLYAMPSGIAAATFPWFNEAGRGLVWGSLITVDDDGLAELDNREGVPLTYDRVLVRTTTGIVAWAYEYQRPVSACTPIADGVWKWEHLKVWRERWHGHAPPAVERRLSTKLLTLDP